MSIIKVEDLSKKYIISHERGNERYSTLRDIISGTGKKIFARGEKNKVNLAHSQKEEFWALKDLSFEITNGDRVGIIGRNGAGKSTLLKVLSRITEPTRGKVTIKGRVASLLEVGTGFHPELTGRENIFLNGAILGMSRAEIRKKFDEIVSFAEVEQFLDTPVKRYSSGMYVRLAFAVAAHLEPEILIVDEVLAVGDAQFQKKCLGKMEDVSRNEGRTVLFVSHNMSTLKSLCTSIIYLKQGQMIKQGGVEETIMEYLSYSLKHAEDGIIPEDFYRKYSSGEAFFTRLTATDADGRPKTEFYFGESVYILAELNVLSDIENGSVSIILSTSSGETFAMLSDTIDGIYSPRYYKKGKYRIKIKADQRLMPLSYLITGAFSKFYNGTPIDWVDHVSAFNVSGVGIQKGADYPWGVVTGYIEPSSSWEVTRVEESKTSI